MEERLLLEEGSSSVTRNGLNDRSNEEPRTEEMSMLSEAPMDRFATGYYFDKDKDSMEDNRRIDLSSVTTTGNITSRLIKEFGEEILGDVLGRVQNVSSKSMIFEKERMKKREMAKREREKEEDTNFNNALKEKVLKAEVRKYEKEISYLLERQLVSQLAIRHLKTEVQVNEEVYEKEKEYGDTIKKVDKLVRGSSLAKGLSVDVNKARKQVETLTAQIRRMNDLHFKVSDRNRKAKIRNESTSLAKHLALEKKWIEKLNIVESLSREYHKKISKNRDAKIKLNRELKAKRRKLMEQGEYVRDILIKLIETINRRESGLSVAQSIRLYSELKKGLEEGIFSISFLRSFLERHPELGMSLNVENFEV